MVVYQCFILIFVLVMGIMKAYVLSNNSNRKLHAVYIDFTAAYDHIKRDLLLLLFWSITNRLPISGFTVYLELISIHKILYLAKTQIRKRIKIHQEYNLVVMRAPVYIIFSVDCVLRIYNHRCKKIDNDHFSLPYYITNKYTSTFLLPLPRPI